MQTALKILVGVCCLFPVWESGAIAAERPTLNHTRDPRPDILPHPLQQHHVEYRLAYNRPRYISGWIAYKIARSSQEAMVWQENLQAGNYDQKHMPPMYKRYFAPKPWEVLQTGPRPDFPKPVREPLEEVVPLEDPTPENALRRPAATPVYGN